MHRRDAESRRPTAPATRDSTMRDWMACKPRRAGEGVAVISVHGGEIPTLWEGGGARRDIGYCGGSLVMG
jgi:hypothetical protein